MYSNSPCLRYGAFKNRSHSSGPVYISIQDLDRHLRLLQVNTICIEITPGPNEPNPQQTVHCMEPLMREVCELKKG